MSRVILYDNLYILPDHIRSIKLKTITIFKIRSLYFGQFSPVFLLRSNFLLQNAQE